MTNLDHTAAIVLAAGKGTRINAKKKNKVAFHLNGKSMIAHTVEHLREAGVDKIYAVVGFQSQSVKEALENQVEYVEQEAQLGTGHAVKVAVPYLSASTRTVLSVYGDDSAFYPPTLFQEMVHKQQNEHCDLLFLTVHKDDPTGLGRIIRDKDGSVARIVEEKNASPEEKKITEINTGFYCFDYKFLKDFISQITVNSLSGEYYLTDMVEIALSAGKKVEAMFVPDSSIWQGVNTRKDLALARNMHSHGKK